MQENTLKQRLEDESRSVRSGSACLKEWPLLHDNNVSPAHLGEIVCGGAPHDTRANDHNSRLVLHQVTYLFLRLGFACWLASTGLDESPDASNSDSFIRHNHDA